MVQLGPLLIVLGTLLTLSILVERLLMVVDWLMERLLIIRHTAAGGEEELARRLEEEKEAQRESELLKTKSGSSGYGVEIETNEGSQRVQPDSRFEIVPTSTPNSLAIIKEYYLQLIGFVIALIGCHYMQVSAMGFFRTEGAKPEAWDYILTAILIGAGSKPIHFLIEFLVSRKIEVARSTLAETPAGEVEQETTVPEIATPVVLTGARPATKSENIESIVGFTYDGGDRPERLENTHRRSKPVDLIVVHHTTLHSDASFGALVKVFDNKGWMTGYHCVVFADGSIRVLCRWDRYGNHALGCNERAVGIAFQGNFEPDPRVPDSNPNGEYGILHPTEQQLDSAARVTAMWTHLFKVPLKFEQLKSVKQTRDPKGKVGIVPHNLIAQKACPGTNFPFDRFSDRVRTYHRQWKANPQFERALSDFAQRPMVLDPAQHLATKPRKGVIV